MLQMSHVARSACMSVCLCMGTRVRTALCKNGRTDRDTILDKDWGGPTEPCIKWGADPLRGKAQFSAVVRAFKRIGNFCGTGRGSVPAKGIIQSPIMLCSRRDHSVCQVSANSILTRTHHEMR